MMTSIKDEGAAGSIVKNQEVVTATVNQDVITLFQELRSHLDEQHDRYERLVKLSRDVTIESKRVIFLLHRVAGMPGDSTDRAGLLAEASARLSALLASKFRAMAKELQSASDAWQYARAFSPGLQEFVEATALLQYLQDASLLRLDSLQRQLSFDDVCPVAPPLRVPVSVQDFLLGLADLTGELMRLSMNCVAAGDLATPRQVHKFLQSVHAHFEAVSLRVGRDSMRKLEVMRASLVKVERACYTMRVRGAEFPEHVLAKMMAAQSETMEHREMHG